MISKTPCRSKPMAEFLRPQHHYGPRKPMATRRGNRLVWLLWGVLIVGWVVTLA